MKNQKEKQEYIVLSVGFLLILFVILFTFFHSNSSDSQASAPVDKNATADNTKDNSADYQTISAKDLQNIITTNKVVTILDIRPFDAYIQEHIIDSVNIAISEFPVGDKIDPKNMVYVVGQNNDDGDIKKAVDELKKENFQKIQVLAGGMDAWKQFIGITVTYGDPTSFVDQTKVSYLNPEDLHNAITSQAPLFIVDVRSASEFSKGHIQGAINVPFDNLEKQRSLITQNRVVVVGDNELQEFQASVQMFDMLKVEPFVMRTAMPGWQTKGFPVTQ